MNNERRKRIDTVIGQLQELAAQLEAIKDEIEEIKDEEQEYFDNMPEGFQQGDKGQAAEAAIGELDYIEFPDIDDIVGYLENAKGQ
jgi:hypothetical protein